MPITDFYIDNGGSNLNAGSTSGIFPIVTYTNGNWDSATRIFTPAAGNPSSDGVTVGSYASIYIDDATLAVYVAQVTAVSSTTLTLSNKYFCGTAPSTSATARSCRVGGAWGGPSGLVTFPFTFATSGLRANETSIVRINIKKHSTSWYVCGASLTPTISAAPMIYEGYNIIPGDNPIGYNRPLFDGSGTAASYVLGNFVNAANCLIKNIIFRNNGTTGTADIFDAGTETHVENCSFLNSRGVVDYGANCTFIDCEAQNMNLANTASRGGFGNNSGTDPVFIRCISANNTGSNSHGFFISEAATNVHLIECLSFKNAQDGINVAGRQQCLFLNCDFAFNLGDGIDARSVATQTTSYIIKGCNFISNSGAAINMFTADQRDLVVLTDNGFFGHIRNLADTTNSGIVYQNNNFTYNNIPYVNPSREDYTVLDDLQTYPMVFNTSSGNYNTILIPAQVGAMQSFRRLKTQPMISRIFN